MLTVNIAPAQLYRAIRHRPTLPDRARTAIISSDVRSDVREGVAPSSGDRCGGGWGTMTTAQYLLPLLCAVLVIFLALLAFWWREQRRMAARLEQFHLAWQEEIIPSKAALLALAEYDAARLGVIAAHGTLTGTPPDAPAYEARRVALIEAHVAYDDACDRLHDVLDRYYRPDADATVSRALRRLGTLAVDHDDTPVLATAAGARVAIALPAGRYAVLREQAADNDAARVIIARDEPPARS